MKIAFSKSTRSDAEAAFLLGQFRRFGYEGLQLKHSQYSPYLGDPERFLAAWGETPGVASALIAGGALDEAGRALLRKVFAFADAVGSERVVFCHAAPREGVTAPDIRSFARTLSDLGKEARDRGLALSLHHHVNQPVMHREDFDVFFGAVRDHAVGLTVDTAHLVKSGIDDIAGLIRDLRDVIDNLHLKDIRNGQFEVIGSGEIDFAPIFAALRDIGYNGWLSADEESGADPAAAMEQCFELIKTGWENALMGTGSA